MKKYLQSWENFKYLTNVKKLDLFKTLPPTQKKNEQEIFSNHPVQSNIFVSITSFFSLEVKVLQGSLMSMQHPGFLCMSSQPVPGHFFDDCQADFSKTSAESKPTITIYIRLWENISVCTLAPVNCKRQKRVMLIFCVILSEPIRFSNLCA